ncbi:hypothetical protein C2W64_01235 [Brevibacillus laterosporus]|nr:hypothetical protein C2W64_01235 [Brevibacillus laterosporus]
MGRFACISKKMSEVAGKCRVYEEEYGFTENQPSARRNK